MGTLSGDYWALYFYGIVSKETRVREKEIKEIKEIGGENCAASAVHCIRRVAEAMGYWLLASIISFYSPLLSTTLHF